MTARGQALVLFALLLPLVLLPAAAYSSEAALVAARAARLNEVAVLAALDAAQQVDSGRLRAGSGLALDATAARSTVAADVAAAEPDATVTAVSVTGAQVGVQLSERVPLRLATFVPGAAVVVTASAQAVLTPGFAAPG